MESRGIEPDADTDMTRRRILAALLALPGWNAAASGSIDFRGTQLVTSSRGAYRVANREGYRDGRQCGTRDGRKRRRYSPWRHARYRSGHPELQQRRGSTAAFAAGYRRGFEHGYHAGYVFASGHHPLHEGYCDQPPLTRAPGRR